MGKVAIMTDSSAGYSKEEIAQTGVFVLPIPLIVNGAPFLEDQDIDMETFYRELYAGSDIKTSQPSPGDVLDLWDQILGMGYDEIVYIPMSSGISESCHNAIALSEDYDGKVQVVDNHRISITLKQTVDDALAYAKEGKSAVEIREILDREAFECSIYIAMDTLKFLKKGGRITGAAAAIGTVLNIKPVLSAQGDKLDAYSKARGMKAAKKSVLQALQHDKETRFQDLYHQGRLGVFIACSDLPKEEVDAWAEEVQALFPDLPFRRAPLSMTMSCHIGPGAFGGGLSIKK